MKIQPLKEGQFKNIPPKTCKKSVPHVSPPKQKPSNYPIIQGNSGRIRRIHIDGLDRHHCGTTDCVTPIFGSILPCQLLGGRRDEPEVSGCWGYTETPKKLLKILEGMVVLTLWKVLNEKKCWEGKQNGQKHSQWFCRWVNIILNMPQTGGNLSFDRFGGKQSCIALEKESIEML